MGIETAVNESLPLYVGGKTLYLTKRAQGVYCRSYKLSEFNEVCLRHIQEQLANAKYYEDDTHIKTEQLVLRKEGNNIISAFINMKLSRQD